MSKLINNNQQPLLANSKDYPNYISEYAYENKISKTEARQMFQSAEDFLGKGSHFDYYAKLVDVFISWYKKNKVGIKNVKS